MKKVLLFLVILFISCNRGSDSYSCTDDIGCVEISQGDSLKIGVLQDLSGGASVFGATQYNSFILALEERGNTLLGHPVELIVEDDKCSEEGGKNGAIKITSHSDVIGVLGTTCSTAASNASKIVTDAGMVLISGSNSASSLTSIGEEKGELWNEGYFRTSTNDSYRVKAAANFSYNNLKARTIVTIDDGDPFTWGAVKIFSKEFEALGGETLLVAHIDKGDSDMKPLLETIASLKPDLIYFPLFAQEGIAIITHLRDFNSLKDVKLLGASPMIVGELKDRLKITDPPIYYPGTVEPEGEGSKDLAKRYRDRFGSEPVGSYTAAFDGVNILLNSIKNVAIVLDDGRIIIPRKKLREELYGIKDYKGVTGSLSCSPYGDLGLNKFSIYRVNSTGPGEIESKVVYVVNTNP